MTILIVEDNEPIRRMIRTMVAGYADEIRECADGAQAVATYQADPADCVLMDIKLATMDGLTAARAIRAIEADAWIAIVTSYEDRDLRNAAMAAGCSAYVLKSNLIPLYELLATRRTRRMELPAR